MMMRLDHLRKHPAVFRAMTGLTVPAFEALVEDVTPAYADAEFARLDHPDRERAIGAGHPFELDVPDRILLTVVWLRVYPTYAVLGYFFGVAESTARRLVEQVLPVLEQAGRDTMRMPEVTRTRGRSLPKVLRETPALAVVIDSFEQPVQRPQRRQRRFYSGKKKRHTVKSQVTVDEDTGRVADVSDTVPGPTHDIELLRRSQVLGKVPPGVGAIGDSGYVGMGAIRKRVLTAVPRKKPRGKPRPPGDRRYNRAFSRRRVVVEHTIGKMRRYQAITQQDRQHRRDHARRVRAIAGLVNRMIDARPAA
ncbi:MAG: transposase [Gemmataceae bacterium]|nr:transposase [Gemmataceae bacterium]